MISLSHRWRKTAVASLVAALCGLSGSSAFALALGRVTVLSALGEPLRAEIDVPDINADEASTLKASIASADAFRAAGLEFNPALAGAQVSLQRRADGRSFIRLSSDRPVNEPFVDLILEASWATGRIVRDYTMLLDPPAMRAAAPAVSVPVAAPQPAATAAVAATPPATASASRPATVPAQRAAQAAQAPGAKAASSADAGNKVTVRAGDSASRIAAANKPAQVSLDQMLAALLRTNSDAFINGNLNRLKAGAVLTIPTQDQALSMAPAEASQTVVAHSRDFNDFRGKLAANAPAVPGATADRAASGSVQAKVEDKKAATPAPDKLTLSKGATAGKAAEVAQDKAAQDAAKRAAELSKNIKDLGSISAASATASNAKATPAAPSLPAPAPAVAVPAPAVAPAVPVAPPVAVGASAPAATPAPVAATSSAPAPAPAPAAAPAKPSPAVSNKTVSEPGFIDGLIDNPLVLYAGGALVALLAGLGIYRSRQRRKTADVDSAFLESRLQPDSFFGSSGGQKVDTNDGAPTGSSMVYSPSQLDAADDVDPVAEADVYLAYGRDIQAEEILREALRTHPGRIAVHQKLLDIFAKRRDIKAFESMAGEAFKLVGAQSPEWARICEQGLGIDPANPLYLPGGAPSMSTQPIPQAVAAAATVAMASAATQKIDVKPDDAPATGSVDLDLDLDFSLDEVSSPSTIIEAQPTRIEPTIAMTAAPPSQPASLDVDFGLATAALDKPAAAATASAAKDPAPELSLPDLSMADQTLALGPNDSDQFRQQAEVSFGSTDPAPLSAPAPVDGPSPEVSFGATVPNTLTATQAPFNPPESRDSGMLEFDLGTLSLELDSPAGAAPAAAPAGEPEDPLATKLALAEEFVSIGDDDGARALIEEVIAEASGDLKAKAQRALSALG